MTEGAEILKQFQLTEDGITKKSDDSYGLKLARYIVSTVNSGVGSYYFNRNARFRQNRNAANGRINMRKFMDLLELNGKVNYVNINWQSIRIINRIISGWVGRGMSKSERIMVKATDPLSVKDKIAEYENIEFVMYNRALLEKLEQESGIQLIPKDTKIPADREELNLWVTQFQRLPEEIKYEMGCNDALASCGWFDVLKDKMLHDSAEVGFVSTYTWMDEQGVIHIDWVKPENAFYSYSEYPDFRDTTWRGQVRAMKISELRRKYGQEFGGKLTEQQLWDIAATAKEFQLGDKISWIDQWVMAYARPYDEWNVDVYEFELKSVDSEPYTVITTKKNTTLIKKGKSGKKEPNEKVIEDTKWNIYRGVYVKDQNIMLEWGLKTNMIRPQDPKEIGNAEFSYSFYMYQMYEMRNLAIPEKIEEPSDQMILARLKMQQLVAKMTPIGAAVNVDALQEIDLGLAGGVSSPSELERIYQQTGRLYYRGRDAEGNIIPVPITELQNAGFLNQMKGLIDLYSFHYQVLKDELGEDPNLIAQALQPRVTSGNVDTAKDASENATGYMYDAYKWVMADTAKKISCLLKDSVVYGSEVYRNLIQSEDVQDRIFGTEIQMLPDERDIAEFEAILASAMQGTPDIVLFVDPFQLKRIAKEDAKLAEQLFRQGQKKMLLHQQQVAKENQEATINGQIESAKVSEMEKRKSLALELKVKAAISDRESNNAIKVATITQILTLRAKGEQIPAEWAGVEAEIIKNVELPLFRENVDNINNVVAELMGETQEQGQTEEQPEMAA